MSDLEIEQKNLQRIKEILGGNAYPGALISDTMRAVVELIAMLEERIVELEVHNQSMEERLRDYLETALVREDVANQRADKAEKRRLPHWTDTPR